MTIQELDFIFPFVVLAYGFVMTLALNSKWMLKLAETRLPDPLARQFTGHRTLGLICLIVGALWSAQNLILG